MKSLKRICADRLLEVWDVHNVGLNLSPRDLNIDLAEYLRKRARTSRNTLFPITSFDLKSAKLGCEYIGDISVSNSANFALIATDYHLYFVSLRDDCHDTCAERKARTVLHHRRAEEDSSSPFIDRIYDEISISPKDRYAIYTHHEYLSYEPFPSFSRIVVLYIEADTDERQECITVIESDERCDYMLNFGALWIEENHCILFTTGQTITEIKIFENPRGVKIWKHKETIYSNPLCMTNGTIPAYSPHISWHNFVAKDGEWHVAGSTVVNRVTGEYKILTEEDAVLIDGKFLDQCIFISNDLRFLVAPVEHTIETYDTKKHRTIYRESLRVHCPYIDTCMVFDENTMINMSDHTSSKYSVCEIRSGKIHKGVMTLVLSSPTYIFRMIRKSQNGDFVIIITGHARCKGPKKIIICRLL